MDLHKSLTLDRIEDGVRRTVFELDNVGFCVSCGFEADSVEGDAERYTCDDCGQATVYGAEYLLNVVDA